jgi:hypothetical protein
LTSAASSPRTTPKPKPKATPKPTPKSTPKSTTYSLSASGASELSCGAAVESSSGASVTFSFVDRSSSDVGVAEIDASGNAEAYGTITPGGTLTVGTNVGAYWMVENSGGGCLGKFGVNGGGEVIVS